MKKYLSLSLLTACAAIGLGTGSAHANGWPTSVVGSWNVQANQSALVLRISTQAAGSGCVAITGTITDLASGGQSNNIQGFFCPLSGRVSFLRKNVQPTTPSRPTSATCRWPVRRTTWAGRSCRRTSPA